VSPSTAAEDGITLTSRAGPVTTGITVVFRAGSPAAVQDPANKLGETNDRTFVDPTVPAPRGVFYYHVIGDLDRDPPLITASASPSRNPHGWNNTDVTVTFECSDERSGISSCPPPFLSTREGVG